MKYAIQAIVDDSYLTIASLKQEHKPNRLWARTLDDAYLHATFDMACEALQYGTDSYGHLRIVGAEEVTKPSYKEVRL